MSRYQCKHRPTSRFNDTMRKKRFVNTKRSARKAEAFKVRRDILSSKDGMGVFDSDQYIPDSASWRDAGGNTNQNSSATHWADITFLSRRWASEGYFYNTTVFTIAEKIIDEIEDEAYEYVESVIPKNIKPEKLFDFEDVEGDSTLKTLVRRDETPIAALGNITRSQVKANYLKEVLENLHSRQAFVSYTKDFSYRYGVGLYIVTDSLTLTEPSIIQDVMRFYDNNEENIKYEVDIFPHLPALRAKLKKDIQYLEHRGKKDFAYDYSAFSDEEKRHLGSGAVAIK